MQTDTISSTNANDIPTIYNTSNIPMKLMGNQSIGRPPSTVTHLCDGQMSAVDGCSRRRRRRQHQAGSVDVTAAGQATSSADRNAPNMLYGAGAGRSAGWKTKKSG